MAQVAQSPQLQATINHYLDYLTRSWESVPLDAQEWEEWDGLSQLTFIVNWGVPEDRLHQLRGWAEQGLLTPAQRARYDALLKLVTQYRPLLEQLFADDSR